jgi:hypothetical protein
MIKFPPKMTQFLNEITYKVNPKFVIKNKAHPTGLYKLVAMIIGLFNKKLATNYITVINGECWYPADNFNEAGDEFIGYEDGAIVVLAHETVHEYDRKRFGTIPFSLMYIFPQILALFAVFSIFAIWNPWWLLCLLFVGFVAPIPSIGRMYLELRGYRVNMMYDRMVGCDIQSSASYYAESYFCSPDYYYMWPFKNYMTKKLLDQSNESTEIYTLLKEWFKKNLPGCV